MYIISDIKEIQNQYTIQIININNNYFYLITSIDALLSESVARTFKGKKNLIFENFKNIISRKYEKPNEKLIYDKIHEEFIKRACIQERPASQDFMRHNQSHSNLNESSYESANFDGVLGQSKTEYSIIDKLKLTRAIWYLPNLKKTSIKKLLKNKEIGVSNFFVTQKNKSI